MSLRETLYPKVEPIAKRIVSFLISQGISPVQLTLAGAALSLLTGVIYAKGYLFLGGILQNWGDDGDRIVMLASATTITRGHVRVDGVVKAGHDLSLLQLLRCCSVFTIAAAG